MVIVFGKWTFSLSGFPSHPPLLHGVMGVQFGFLKLSPGLPMDLLGGFPWFPHSVSFPLSSFFCLSVFCSFVCYLHVVYYLLYFFFIFRLWWPIVPKVPSKKIKFSKWIRSLSSLQMLRYLYIFHIKLKILKKSVSSQKWTNLPKNLYPSSKKTTESEFWIRFWLTCPEVVVFSLLWCHHCLIWVKKGTGV